MGLRTKVRNWLAGALVLIAGGAAVTTAVIRSAQDQGLTCVDAQKIVNAMESRGIGLLIPFMDHIVPSGCNIKHEVKCSRLDDGTFCRSGMRYGPGRGGVICPADPSSEDPCVLDACDVDDGQPIPCVSVDGRFKDGQYDPDNFDKQAFLRMLKKKFSPNDEFGELLPDTED